MTREEHIQIVREGVPIDVWYVIEGGYIPETQYEPAEYPTITVTRAEIGGLDVTAWDGRIMDFADLVQAELEASHGWRAWR